ncbi:type II toxin-antitoxin system RelE/ParE family toxin [Flavobacterium sp. WLB]|uniref:type II toxin-antitoxin system RelE/ParE family toxin n=1 Tax=unclassified Flavobacterium TaxID=196869 RepID=UPI0006ABE7D6|nr:MULTISPECIES: type II toxin-antitoxin system RelE/ParE family toxin [unclassified Flavobacterium]KOP40258.1 plasmid stabilization protein [Flavobacterium sp. VMW]OWU91354.1 plasmid stabilization protein [Flavobacterium sp. NLM]PUU71108.1 type II toxin-antitoxin system RelE/ParE family toxin [Flavobacterium sp. WLB]
MALKFIWTSQAVKGFNKIVDYLEEKWTKKEILNLEDKIRQVINQINLNPDQFPKSVKNESLYKAIVDKNNYLVYRLNKESNTIEIINFRGTKQKPKY